MATELEELQTLNATLTDFLNYVKDKDTAAATAATAAAEQAAIDKAAAEQAAAEQAAAEQAAAAAAATAESDYRTAVLNAIAELNAGEPTAAPDYTQLLTEIRTTIEPNADQSAVEYYADLSVIVLVCGLIPVYIAYRLTKIVFDMLVRAF